MQFLLYDTRISQNYEILGVNMLFLIYIFFTAAA